MYKKKILALTVAALLPFSAALMAEESSMEGAAGSSEQAAVDNEPVAAEESSQERVAVAEPVENEDPRAQRLKELDAQYEALRKRAEEAGVMLPKRSPWEASRMRSIRPSMEERMEHRRQMMSMTQQERDVYRQERREEMRQRAEEMGLEMPETPPWAARQQAMQEQWAEHQKVIEGMSDEERAACHAMVQRHRSMGMGPGHQGMGCAGQGGCMGPRGWSQPGMMPYGQPGYGYGYGYAPGPSPYGPDNFWNPEQ